MQDYGIDLQSLNAPAPPQGQSAPTQEGPLVSALQQRLDKLESHLTTQERERAQAEYTATVNTVNSFGSDPKNKFFPSVRADMAVLIESGAAKDLADAYEKACWANADVRKLMMADIEKERANARAAEAAKARQASGVNVARRGTPPAAPSKPTDMTETIRQAYRSITSGS
jgi:hypothetical protein